VADAIVRAFSVLGDRTDRKKARLKYVLDALGFDAFLGHVEEKLGRKLTRIASSHVEGPKPPDRLAHVGVHAQKQDGFVWVGVATPVGKMTVTQMQALADLANTYGDGDIRLTVWQNALISGVRAEKAAELEGWLKQVGLTSAVSAVRAGLVACTGNTGCKFANANTKDTAVAIADWVDRHVALDGPINIHLTGCPNSCAQHYIGDIGMIACRVPVPGSDDTEEGFHILAGGGFAEHGGMARELYRDVKIAEVPARVVAMLKAYLANRTGKDETFQAFTRRLEPEALRALMEPLIEAQAWGAAA
jgi:ferredoxin-nitrite reductase